MKKMYLDIKAAFELWQESNQESTFKDFLEVVGISRQTAHNLQNGKGKNLPLSAAQKLKDITGKPMDELIKPK